MIIMIIQI